MCGVDLYDDLGVGYDLIINWERRLARETPFYQGLFQRHGVRRLVDVGCGTGWHARLFAGWGLQVVGVDPSQAMLDAARQVTEGLPVALVRGGFEDLPLASQPPFDAVVCLGNTLPHALTPQTRLAALRGFCHSLVPGGVCVVQTLNYDVIRATGERFQPLAQGTIAGREELLLRMFDFGPETWEFHILRFTRAEGSAWVFNPSSTRHLPVYGEEIASQLAAAGFSEVRLLGGFDQAPFDPHTSEMLLAVAVR
ncbi:MAG: class I SAM-dependent methyltransferase [Armatimonadota bacterium]|nr:class I SAM-dependent methyltransferase [Armatimonadota bacterium]